MQDARGCPDPCLCPHSLATPSARTCLDGQQLVRDAICACCWHCRTILQQRPSPAIDYDDENELEQPYATIMPLPRFAFLQLPPVIDEKPPVVNSVPPVALALPSAMDEMPPSFDDLKLEIDYELQPFNIYHGERRPRDRSTIQEDSIRKTEISSTTLPSAIEGSHPTEKEGDRCGLHKACPSGLTCIYRTPGAWGTCKGIGIVIYFTYLKVEHTLLYRGSIYHIII